MFIARLTIIFLSLAVLAPALAGEQEQLRKAEKYFRTDKQGHFKTLSEKFDKNSLYSPLIAYWRGRLELRRDKDAAAQTFIAQTKSPYLRDNLRRTLLENYAKKKNWQDFATYAPGGSDCAVALASFTSGDEKNTALLRTLWQQEKRFSNALCVRLYQTGKRAGALTNEDIWLKLRALAGKRELSVTRRLLRAFPGYIRYSSVRKVANRAVRYIRGKHPLETRPQRELVMIAAMAAARKDIKTAIRRWGQFSQYFSKDENDHVWTVLAEWASRWHRKDALVLYQRTSGKFATNLSRAWYVRAALRANDYAEVVKVIEQMPAEQRRISAWRYWHAIGLQKRGEDAAAEEALRALAADEDDYYGLLAGEAVGIPLTKPLPPPPPAKADGDLALALALYRAGLKTMATRIWKHAIKDEAATDKRLLAAAQQAAAIGWNLASINAANEAKTPAAFEVRFPLPFRDDISKYSSRFALDEAFVYGLIRQESRFMPKVVSSANARGLMQVIPRTARSVARKHHYTRYNLSRLIRVETNIIIGTTYLADLADSLNANPVKVAAGYNAGPGRVRRWYKVSPKLLVMIENIPLTETRLYVKHLLANRLHYSQRLNQKPQSMRALISLPMRQVAAAEFAPVIFPAHFALLPQPNLPAGQ